MPRLHSPLSYWCSTTDTVGRQGAGSSLIKSIKISLLGPRIGWIRVQSESEGADGRNLAQLLEKSLNLLSCELSYLCQHRRI